MGHPVARDDMYNLLSGYSPTGFLETADGDIFKIDDGLESTQEVQI
jgi:hypothetical protein